MFQLNKDAEWSQGAVSIDPIPHGSPAESFYITQIDQMQIAALWGAVPNWSSNCVLARGSTTQIPVVLPPFVRTAKPVIIASGEGNVSFEAGDSVIAVTGSASELAIGFSGYYEGAPFDVSASAADPVEWIRVLCDTNVRVFAIQLMFDRGDTSISGAS